MPPLVALLHVRTLPRLVHGLAFASAVTRNEEARSLDHRPLPLALARPERAGSPVLESRARGPRALERGMDLAERRERKRRPGLVPPGLSHAGAPPGSRSFARCDNEMVVWLNGEQVIASDNWYEPITLDVTELVVPGENALAVSATNWGGPAGLFPGALVDRLGGNPAPNPDGFQLELLRRGDPRLEPG